MFGVQALASSPLTHKLPQVLRKNEQNKIKSPVEACRWMLGLKEQAVEDRGAAAMTAEAELGVSCSLKLRACQRLDMWHVTYLQLCSSSFLAEYARRRCSIHDPSVCYITLDTGWFFDGLRCLLSRQAFTKLSQESASKYQWMFLLLLKQSCTGLTKN